MDDLVGRLRAEAEDLERFGPSGVGTGERDHAGLMRAAAERLEVLEGLEVRAEPEPRASVRPDAPPLLVPEAQGEPGETRRVEFVPVADRELLPSIMDPIRLGPATLTPTGIHSSVNVQPETLGSYVEDGVWNIPVEEWEAMQRAVPRVERHDAPAGLSAHERAFPYDAAGGRCRSRQVIEGTIVRCHGVRDHGGNAHLGMIGPEDAPVVWPEDEEVGS